MEIMLPAPIRKELERDFNVSRITVWKALNGKSGSKKANMIRQAAFDRGGKIYEGRACK